MAVAEKVPVNSEILIWARNDLNLSIDEVSRKMGKKEEVILAWENGEDFPTYSQLEKLAYEIYRVPFAVFFLPEPPEKKNLKSSFRTLPDIVYDNIPSSIMLLFKNALSMQNNLYEIFNGKNESKNNILNDFKYTNKNIKNVANEIREFLGVTIEEQKSWSNSDIALKKWRDLIEKSGIYIFKNAFKQDDFSGFCIYDDEFPIIYINNSMSKNRQIFTIFHELWHLISQTSGIDKRNDNEIINLLYGEDKNTEIACNEFAGEFLVPSNDFEKHIEGLKIDEKAITNLARLYNVSKEVILRKCYDRNLVNSEFYQEHAEKWIAEAKNNKQDENGRRLL